MSAIHGNAKPRLAIVAGSGRLPKQLADACRETGREVFILAFEDVTDADVYAGLPHAVVRVEAVDKAIACLQGASIGEVVLAGRVRRPSLMGMRASKTAARLMAHMGASFLGGDNAMFKSIVTFLEKEGFKVVGPDDVLSDLVAPEGILGSIAPDAESLNDIALGMRAVKALGALDIGQAAVVERGYVLGLEAAEGTDEMIARCAGLKRAPKSGVLVKAKKPSQETRVDLPAIGPQTIRNAHAAGLAGIAVEAEGALMLEREALVRVADELGLFVVGVRHE